MNPDGKNLRRETSADALASGTPRLRRIALRNWASGRVHYADVMAEAIIPNKIFGADCHTVIGPVRALCKATLRQFPLVLIPAEHVQGRKLCPTCEFAVEAVEEAPRGGSGGSR